MPLASLLSRTAFAAYPDKPIRLIVPFAAGGNADLVARIVGEAMSPSLGQPIVVEARAGAGGSIGAAAVATAAPDGYTLLTGSNGPLTVNPFVQAKLPYDPLKDFVPIGLANLAPHSIVLNNSVQAKTLAELIEMSKKQQITLGTAGVGSASHMTLARFNAVTGAKFVHVPYRGGGALVPDVLAGTVSGAMTEVSTLLAHHGQGKIRIFAVASAKRLSRLPDVPTMIELGVKDFTAASYVGVLAPAKTPSGCRRNFGKGPGQGAGRQVGAGQVHSQRRGAGAGRIPDLEGVRRLYRQGIREFEAGRPARRPQAGIGNT